MKRKRLRKRYKLSEVGCERLDVRWLLRRLYPVEFDEPGEFQTGYNLALTNVTRMILKKANKQILERRGNEKAS